MIFINKYHQTHPPEPKVSTYVELEEDLMSPRKKMMTILMTFVTNFQLADACDLLHNMVSNSNLDDRRARKASNHFVKKKG